LLAQETVRKFGDRAHFVVENFGASPLAERFGVDKYPAIFVDDALVARPEDFYPWGKPGTGKYVPWNDLANRRKFQSDLQRMIDLRLAGGAVKSAVPVKAANAAILPAVDMVDLDGLAVEDSEGKPTTLAGLLDETYTDGFLVLKHGKTRREEAQRAIQALELELERETLGRLDGIFPGYRPAPEDYAW